eukprot:TRINITY_DN565_c0_g1_i5.p3 TRINITY_DN565_c0_g1~~TRINITY_DN565_c0_g1_i5.p3  ORF type:complete len:187 (-),score=18.79 TRINITY_DN565_c0_g1_i5:1758-2318(-)
MKLLALIFISIGLVMSQPGRSERFTSSRSYSSSSSSSSSVSSSSSSSASASSVSSSSVQNRNDNKINQNKDTSNGQQSEMKAPVPEPEEEIVSVSPSPVATPPVVSPEQVSGEPVLEVVAEEPDYPVAAAVAVNFAEFCAYRGLSCNWWQYNTRHFKLGNNNGCYSRRACNTEGSASNQECLNTCY